MWKEEGRPSQPLPPQLKYQTCEWGLWILWPQWSSANLSHVEQRWTIPSDCCPVGELWEIIIGCVVLGHEVWGGLLCSSRYWNKALNTLPPLLLPQSSASCFPTLFPHEARAPDLQSYLHFNNESWSSLLAFLFTCYYFQNVHPDVSVWLLFIFQDLAHTLCYPL